MSHAAHSTTSRWRLYYSRTGARLTSFFSEFSLTSYTDTRRISQSMFIIHLRVFSWAYGRLFEQTIVSFAKSFVCAVSVRIAIKCNCIYCYKATVRGNDTYAQSDIRRTSKVLLNKGGKCALYILKCAPTKRKRNANCVLCNLLYKEICSLGLYIEIFKIFRKEFCGRHFNYINCKLYQCIRGNFDVYETPFAFRKSRRTLRIWPIELTDQYK